MSLISCEINLILTWFDKCMLSNDNKATIFALTDAKFYVPVETLSTHDITSYCGSWNQTSKRIYNWNKYQLKLRIHVPNPYLDYLIVPGLQGVDRRFALSIENPTDRRVYTQYYLAE